MTPRQMRNLSLAILGLMATAPSLVQAQPASSGPASPPNCFRADDWSGWKLTPDAKAMYIKVRRKDVYRVEFAGSCPALGSAFAHPVLRLRGSSWICHPLDFDMKVADGNGIPTHCMVSKLVPLSSDEAAALPNKLKP